MRYCFIVSGIPRSFIKKLHIYFIELNNEMPNTFDVYINFGTNVDDYKYLNRNFNITILEKYSFYKYIYVTPNIQFNSHIAKKDCNILNQWSKVLETFNNIKEDYDIYIRIRPDIELLISPQNLVEILNKCNNNSIYIPHGYNFIDGIKQQYSNCINDQIAISNKNIMNIYSKFINYFIGKENPFKSEELLLKYLQENNVNIERIILPYKLILSDCKVISISGDSGSGKSTLLDAINNIFLFDSSLVLETDRYHKWERTSKNWEKYTHLHPDANNLEKMSEDIFRLKIGEDIFAVDYDHSTGKFTSEQQITSKPVILLCGLHTIYDKSIRDLSELKLFIDTASLLKNEWKINRDILKRGKTLETILANIETRKNDYKLYIEPQKLYADIIIEYKYEETFQLILHVNKVYNYYINIFLSQISLNIHNTTYKSYSSYYINNIIDDSIFNIFIKDKNIITKLKEFPFNVIQTVVYLSLYNDK